MFELVRKLTGTFGVAGFESKIKAVIESEIRPYVDEIHTDSMNNIIAVKKGITAEKAQRGSVRGGQPGRVMFAAHMDEIGFVVTFVEDDGFLRVSGNEGIYPQYAVTQRFIFENGTCGIVFNEPKKRSDDNGQPKANELFIDIGTNSRDETLKKVNIGDAAASAKQAVMQGGRIISKALDDRAGCAVLVQIAKEMHDERIEPDNDVYFVFTVQEEYGFRGAKTAAFAIDPDLAVVIDLTATGDVPGCDPMNVRLGSGPAIKLKDCNFIVNQDVRVLLEDTAKRFSIPYQLEILDHGMTDAGVIFTANKGIPTGAVSIPGRYIHSSAEMIDIKDLLNCVRLLKSIFIR